MAKINRDILERDLRFIIAEIVGIDEEEITPEASFIKDLGMDSMMALEILAAVERKYKPNIPEDYLSKLTNLKQVIDIVDEFLSKQQ